MATRNLDGSAASCPTGDTADVGVVAGVSDASYLVRAYHAGLSAERLLQVTAGDLTITDAGTPGTDATTTIGLLAVGPGAGTLAFPTSITLDAKGRVTAFASALAGASVLGRAAAGAAGAPAAITGSTPGHVLTVQGDGSIAFSAAAATGYATVENPNGTPVTQRQIISFSTSFTATDNVDTTDIAIASGGISRAHLANGTAGSVIGRAAAAPGVVADILSTSNGVLKENGAGAISFDLISTANLNLNVVTNSRFRQSAALSVVGNATNATADVADIVAASDGHALRRSGTTLGFGTLASGAFADSTISGARLTGFTNTTLPVANSSGQLTSSTITLIGGSLIHELSSSGLTVFGVVRNTSNTASSDAQVLIETGGTSAGSPSTRWRRGTTEWLGGLNGASEGRFTLQTGTAFTSTPAMSIHPTTRNVCFRGEASNSGFGDVLEFIGTNATANIFRLNGAGGSGDSYFRIDHGGSADGGIMTHVAFGRGYFMGVDGSATGDPWSVATNDGAGGGSVLGTNDIQRWHGQGPNIDFFVSGNTNFQSMTKGFFLGNASAAPSGNPTSGVFEYIESGKHKIRDPDGFITTLN